MKSVAYALNEFYLQNSHLLERRTRNPIKAGKCIFRPITTHIHNLFDQFENKIVFDIKHPNKKVNWGTKGPSTWSQKRRVFTCFGLTREKEKDGLDTITLNLDGEKIRNEYFKNKEKYKRNIKEIPEFIKKFYINKIQDTDLNNINIGTNTVICGLRYIVNENFFYNLNITTVKEFKLFPERESIKGYYYRYFNHKGDSGDLLDWVKGILQPLGIIEKSNLSSSEVLDITKESAKKISVWSLTNVGEKLVNSLSILKSNIQKYEIKEYKASEVEIDTRSISYYSKEEYQDKRSRVPKQKKIISRKLIVSKNKLETVKNIIRNKYVNPEHSKEETEKASVTHANTLAEAGIYIDSKGYESREASGNVDLYFESNESFHIFEIKSWAAKIHNRTRDGLIKLLEYTYQNKETLFKNKKCNMNLLFSKNPITSFNAYPHLAGLMKNLKIGLCYMENKKIVWHKEFKDYDPFN